MYQSIYYDRNTKQCYLRDSIEGWKVFKYYPQVYKRISKNQKGALPVLTGGYCLPIKKGERWDWNDPDILEKDINPEVAILRTTLLLASAIKRLPAASVASPTGPLSSALTAGPPSPV